MKNDITYDNAHYFSLALRLFCAVIVLVTGFAAPSCAQNTSKNTPGQITEKRMALVIGNARYRYTPVLKNPVRDASAIAGTLQKLGFDVTYVTNLTAEKFAETVAKFIRKLKHADVALLYYAGHGLQFRSQNYLVPIDARLANEFSLPRETMNVTMIIRRMEEQTRINLVFLDACRNNPLTRNLRRSLVSTRSLNSIGRGLAKMPSLGGETLLIYAAAPGALATDGAGKNSPFAKALVKHLATPGLEVEVMLKRVTSFVRKETGEQQKPERLSRLTSEFYFAGKPEEIGVLKQELKILQQQILTQKKQQQARLKQLAAHYQNIRTQKKTAQEQHKKLLAKKRRKALQNAALRKQKDLEQRENAARKKRNLSRRQRMIQLRKDLKKIRHQKLAALQQAKETLRKTDIKTDKTQKQTLQKQSLRLPYEPRTVKIPAGHFLMGCVRDPACQQDEKPVHRVTLDAFYMSITETTFDQWDACVAGGGCTHTPKDKGWGRGQRPVIYVSWHDASQYARWLSKMTGKIWRLPTEAQWEYAARAGTTTPYAFGKDIDKTQANFYFHVRKTTRAGHYPANPFGLYDMHGNVWEWVADRYSPRYPGKSVALNPQGRTGRTEEGSVPQGNAARVFRGGSWLEPKRNLRVSDRNNFSPKFRSSQVGFRLVRIPR